MTKGEFQASIEVFNKLVIIHQNANGMTHETIIQDYRNIYACYKQLQDIEKSATYLNLIFLTSKSVHGLKSVETCDILDELMNFFFETQKFREAFEILQTFVDVTMEVHGENSEAFIRTLICQHKLEVISRNLIKGY
jgi:tetratricopeptide (TPR) repeat protein